MPIAAMSEALRQGIIWGIIGAGIGAVIGLIRWLLDRAHKGAKVMDRPQPSAGTAPFARGIRYAREILRMTLGLIIAIVITIIMFIADKADGLDSHTAASIAVVAMLASVVWCLVAAVLFVSRRGIDLCPKCRRRKPYYRRDDRLSLRCNRCGYVWPAGTNRVRW